MRHPLGNRYSSGSPLELRCSAHRHTTALEASANAIYRRDDIQGRHRPPDNQEPSSGLALRSNNTEMKVIPFVTDKYLQTRSLGRLAIIRKYSTSSCVLLEPRPTVKSRYALGNLGLTPTEDGHEHPFSRCDNPFDRRPQQGTVQAPREFTPSNICIPQYPSDPRALPIKRR